MDSTEWITQRAASCSHDGLDEWLRVKSPPPKDDRKAHHKAYKWFQSRAAQLEEAQLLQIRRKQMEKAMEAEPDELAEWRLQPKFCQCGAKYRALRPVLSKWCSDSLSLMQSPAVAPEDCEACNLWRKRWNQQ